MMQQTQLDDSVASSSHGGQLLRRPVPRRLPNAAAMVRHWLRELAALLQQRRVGDSLPLLLETASQAVESSAREPEMCGNGSVDGGPTKKRRIMNSLSVARMRLQDLTDEDDVDGLNQHQIKKGPRGSLLRPYSGGQTTAARYSQPVGVPSATGVPGAGTSAGGCTNSALSHRARRPRMACARVGAGRCDAARRRGTVAGRRGAAGLCSPC